MTYNVNSGRDKAGRIRSHTVCGILMYSSLAVTTEGLPLGLAAVKFWTRKKFKGTAALKKKVNLTRIPIEKKESVRWLDNLRQSTRPWGTRYIIKIAKLGDYLARANDPAPGNIVMWRGLSRLTDIELGVMAGAKFVGN